MPGDLDDVGVLKHVTRFHFLRTKVRPKGVQSQRLPREAVAARLARLQPFFDSEVFGGWLSKHGSLERLELLHSVYTSDTEFLSALCGLCLWTPDDLIGDTSVLSISEPTIIGSSTSAATWYIDPAKYPHVTPEHIQLSCHRLDSGVIVRLRNNASPANAVVVRVERPTSVHPVDVLPGTEIDLRHMDMFGLDDVWFLVLLQRPSLEDRANAATTVAADSSILSPSATRATRRRKASAESPAEHSRSSDRMGEAVHSEGFAIASSSDKGGPVPSSAENWRADGSDTPKARAPAAATSATPALGFVTPKQASHKRQSLEKEAEERKARDAATEVSPRGKKSKQAPESPKRGVGKKKPKDHSLLQEEEEEEEEEERAQAEKKKEEERKKREPEEAARKEAERKRQEKAKLDEKKAEAAKKRREEDKRKEDALIEAFKREEERKQQEAEKRERLEAERKRAEAEKDAARRKEQERKKKEADDATAKEERRKQKEAEKKDAERKRAEAEKKRIEDEKEATRGKEQECKKREADTAAAKEERKKQREDEKREAERKRVEAKKREEARKREEEEERKRTEARDERERKRKEKKNEEDRIQRKTKGDEERKRKEWEEIVKEPEEAEAGVGEAKAGEVKKSGRKRKELSEKPQSSDVEESSHVIEEKEDEYLGVSESETESAPKKKAKGKKSPKSAKKKKKAKEGNVSPEVITPRATRMRPHIVQPVKFGNDPEAQQQYQSEKSERESKAWRDTKEQTKQQKQYDRNSLRRAREKRLSKDQQASEASSTLAPIEVIDVRTEQSLDTSDKPAPTTPAATKSSSKPQETEVIDLSDDVQTEIKQRKPVRQSQSADNVTTPQSQPLAQRPLPVSQSAELAPVDRESSDIPITVAPRLIRKSSSQVSSQDASVLGYLDRLLVRLHGQHDPVTGKKLLPMINGPAASPSSQLRPNFDYGDLHHRAKAGLFPTVEAFAREVQRMLTKSTATVADATAKKEMQRLGDVLRSALLDEIQKLLPKEHEAVRRAFQSR